MSTHTLQQLLNTHLPRFIAKRSLPLYQVKALERLSVCRTEVLGGHAQYCENDHLNGVWYNSCKQRYCPQCRAMATEEWLINTIRVLLDCPHQHVVFTIPSEFNIFWQYNLGKMRDLLFKAVQETLKVFSLDPKFLGAMPGIICALHTWGRNLCLHPHTHVLISHGGIDKDGEWVQPKRDILFPQKPVMLVYRGILRRLIKEAIKMPGWKLPPDLSEIQAQNLVNKLGQKEWVVHFSERYDYADGVAKYLSRYVKSGPLKNKQLKEVTDTSVTFSYKSHRTKRVETLTLAIESFFGLLSQHIPEPGKPTVRYSGLYNSAAREKLNKARSALGQSEVSERELLKWQAYLEEKCKQPRCKECGSLLIKLVEVYPVRKAS